MTRSEILAWLRLDDESELETLWLLAEQTRREHVGDAVHLRGLVEISNHCVRECHYCGLRAPNEGVSRYRMTADEILACAREAESYGYGTVVLQSGEDYGLTTQWVAQLVSRIKAETKLAITLSLGERGGDELAVWRDAGADRYLLRFETSSDRLYQRIHPPLRGVRSDRLAILRRLRELGYEVGSGVMIGIPGQTFADLADDLVLFRELDLDMIGVGPFIPYPGTPLGHVEPHVGDQVPSTELMTYKVIALSRRICPRANIPSTTALATLNEASGRELGLLRGANVMMPNVTPPRYRHRYEVYPGKACLWEATGHWHASVRGRIESMGRTVGVGRGDSPSRRMRSLKSVPRS